MAEPKRLQLTAIETQKTEPENKAAPALTARFDLSLGASTDETCPEFSFSDLLKTVPDEEKKSTDDPFGDDDDEEKLAAIARDFEDRYKPTAGKKKRGKNDNMAYVNDLGDGYDDSDTFIDNSEAYDDFIPAELTTKLGGFYINSGRLDLREISDDSEDEFQQSLNMLKKNNKKKRRIVSDDESDEELPKVVKKKKLKDGLSMDGEIKKKKKKKLLPDGEKPFKKPKQPQDKDKPKQLKPPGSGQLKPPPTSVTQNQNGEAMRNGVLSLAGNNSTEVTSSVEAIVSTIDSVIADSVIAATTRDDSDSRGEFEEQKEIDPEKIPKLAINIPAALDQKIEQLKSLAREPREGKSKFFTAAVNRILLEVEMASKQMTVGNRSAMYGHLSAFLPCSKDTLVKRAKTLRLKEMEEKLKVPLERLKAAVGSRMPALQEKYEEEVKKAAQEKNGDSKDGQKEKEGREDGGTDSDEEKTDQPEATKERNPRLRKRFALDNSTRMLLCDVVKIKMQNMQMSKTRTQTAEEFCKAFLDSDVKPIWPKGWMQTSVLYRESRMAHISYTNPQKPKKAVTVMKAPGSAPLVNQCTKLVNMLSAPPGVIASKITQGAAGTKFTPIVTLTKVPVPSSLDTPVRSNSAVKVVPTLLDYADIGSVQKSQNPASLPNKLSSTNSAMNTQLSTAGTIDSAKSSGISSRMDTKQVRQAKISWDHIVSDILKSSLTDTDQPSPMTTSPPQLQRQTSQENSFMAQFQNFANSVLQKSPPQQRSPNQSPGQSKVATHSQLPSQSQHTGQGHHPSQGQLVGQGQTTVQGQLTTSQKQELLKQQMDKMAREQNQQQQQIRRQQMEQERKLRLLQEQKLKTDTVDHDRKMQQLKLLKESQKAMLEQQKETILKQQTDKVHQAQQKLAAKLHQQAGVQPGSEPKFINNTNAQRMQQQTGNPALGKVMVRSVVPGQTVHSVSQNQLFSSQPKQGQSVSLLTENVIRQQLDRKTHEQPNVSNSVYSRVSASSDQLRKSSPQSFQVPASMPSQVKVTGQQQPQVLKVTSAQGQGYPSNSPVSNGEAAASQRLSGLEAGNRQEEYRQYEERKRQQKQQQQKQQQQQQQQQKQQQQWNPSPVSSTSPQRYPGSGDAPTKPYIMPVASSRQVAGYQNVKLPELTNERMAAYPTTTGMPAQSHLGAEVGHYGNQILSHSSPGSHSPQSRHLSSPHTLQHSSPQRHNPLQTSPLRQNSFEERPGPLDGSPRHNPLHSSPQRQTSLEERLSVQPNNAYNYGYPYPDSTQ